MTEGSEITKLLGQSFALSEVLEAYDATERALNAAGMVPGLKPKIKRAQQLLFEVRVELEAREPNA